MSRRFNKKRVVAVVSVVTALGIATFAYAYLTASGSGSGSGDVSATASSMTLSISSAPALTKIGDSETYEITASNPGTSPEHVSGITVGSIGPSTAAAGAGCPADSFTADAPTTTGTEVPAAGTAVVGHVLVHFVDRASAQNGCLGVGTVAISLSST
jgi:hypothetical protein